MLTPQEYQEAKQVFEQVIDLPTHQRAAWLKQHCANNQAVLDEVTSLLASDENRVDFLEQSAVGLVDRASVREGTVVGPYLIVSELGRGGMGTVYLAEQREPMLRKVAIKILNRGMNTDDIVARFHNERQILANLEHPNIAAMYNGGETADGLPWFAMEFVPGQPIYQWCEQRKLNTRGRLELFVKVCTAVSFAHRNLVVHRDLKPGNILVTNSGEPKLLDFGIARVLDSDHHFTRTGLMAMTPEYASPEQIAGGPVTTASDIYSLGVLLYELLSGHRPYRLSGKGISEVVRLMDADLPPKPSSVITRHAHTFHGEPTETVSPEWISATREGSPQKLKRALSGDVDNIVMQALRRQPGMRYPSVAAFGQDIENHLSGFPVTARKGTLAYTASLFISRYRMVSALIASVCLMAVVLTGMFTVQWVRAEEERQKAEAVTDHLVGLLASSDPFSPEGGQVTVRQLLANQSEDFLGLLHGKDQVRAELLQTMARLLYNQGIYDKAQPLAEEAVRMIEYLPGRQGQQLADCLHLVGEIRFRMGRFNDAVAPLERAARINLNLGDKAPLERARNLDLLGEIYSQLAHYPAAEHCLKDAYAIRVKRLDPFHPDIESTMSNLVLLYYRLSRFEEIDGLFADLPKTAGQSEAGGLLPFFLAVLEHRKQTLGPDHPEVTTTLYRMGRLMLNPERKMVNPYLSEALQIRQQRLGKDHPLVAECMRHLGYSSNNLDQGIALLEEASRIEQQTLDPYHPYYAETLLLLGSKYMFAGDYQSSERCLEQALDIMERVYGRPHPRISWTYFSMGRLYYSQGRYETAVKTLSCALEDQTAPSDGMNTALRERQWLVLSLLRLERYEQAETMARDALDLLLGSQNIYYASKMIVLLGCVYLEAGQYDRALQHCETYLALCHERSAPERSIKSILNLQSEIELRRNGNAEAHPFPADSVWK